MAILLLHMCYGVYRMLLYRVCVAAIKLNSFFTLFCSLGHHNAYEAVWW